MNAYTFTIKFENGLPKGTAQQKGETIRYKVIDGRRVPYIHHFKKEKVNAARQEFELRLRKYRPRNPTAKPVRLSVWFFFNVADRARWGTYKASRPDVDGYLKEFLDAMTAQGFWFDDAQVVDLRIVKSYAEQGAIWVRFEEIENIKAVGV